METKSTTVESTNNVQSKSVPSKKVVSSSDDEDEEVCLICCNPITFYSVGPCNHRQTCSMCSIRLRELYKDKECPFCKKTNDKVVFTTNKTLPFEEFKLSELIEESALGIYTDSNDHISTIKQLWDARCPVCSIYYVEFAELKKHIKAAHQSQYCELCLQERKIFLHEQKVYNKKQLQQHMREGDEGSQIKGHPKCEFCDRALYSSDQLYEHLERNHFTCHICEKDGHRFQYYKDYNQLEKHFASAHYLCPERDCLEKKFIVFRTLLDLQAHELNVHGYKFSKQEQTKLRQIQVNFTVSRSEEPRSRNNNNTRYDRQEFDRHIAAPTTNVFQNNASPTVSHPELKKEEEVKVEPPKENKKNVEEELKQELAARNKKLIQTMKDILQDDTKFKEFRTTSGQFLTGAITELQYYKSFVTTFGPKKADELFSELIDLLPDETKREKLLAAQRKSKEEEKEYPQLPAQPPKPAKNKKKTTNTTSNANSVWKAPAATTPVTTTTTTTTTTTSSKIMKPAVEGIHCSECGEQVPSKDWDKHLKLHARQKQQIEEQAKQVKIQEEQRKREAEDKKREEEKKKEDEQAQRNKLSSSSEFPSLPGGAPPGLNLMPKSATIFNRKAFSEQDFPSLPMAQRPPPGIKFEDVVQEPAEEEQPYVGKKGKIKQKKVVLRWG